MEAITGSVTRINAHGDLVTDIAVDRVAHLLGKTQVEIRFGDYFTQGVFPRNHGEPANTLIAACDSFLLSLAYAAARTGNRKQPDQQPVTRPVNADDKSADRDHKV